MLNTLGNTVCTTYYTTFSTRGGGICLPEKNRILSCMWFDLTALFYDIYRMSYSLWYFLLNSEGCVSFVTTILKLEKK